VTFALVGSLGALPEGQREVAALCLLGDSSYEAAASELEVPVGTVRSRLYRARLSLALAVRGADGSQPATNQRKSCRNTTSAST
jgi:DNA-directed RNA polymerase specialized sigma24 family protein